MAGLIPILILGIGIAVVLLIVARSHDQTQALGPGLALLGCLMTLLAFAVLPWAVPGPPGAFAANVRWLAQQTNLVDQLHDMPVFSAAVPIIRADPSVGLNSLPGPVEQSQFLQRVQQGMPLRGWHVWQFSKHISPWLSITLSLGMLATMIVGLAGLANLVRTTSLGRIAGLGGAALALASLLLLAGRIATVDTLGSTNHFPVRFIAALAEVRVGPGPWWMAVGLTLIACSGLVYLLSGDSTPPQRQDAMW